MKHLQAGDIQYKEQSSKEATRNRVEIDGISAEQNSAMVKVSTHINTYKSISI